MGLLRIAAAGALLGLVLAGHPSACANDDECSAASEDELARPQSGSALIQARGVQQKQEVIEEDLTPHRGGKHGVHPHAHHGRVGRTPERSATFRKDMAQNAAEALTCVTGTCMNFHDIDRARECGYCMASAITGNRDEEMGVNGVSNGFIADEIRETSSPRASHATATKTSNFPGDGTTSVIGWDEVAEMQQKSPAKEWSGEWWRGNELGFGIGNPFFWSQTGVNPMTMVTGILPSQHAAIRPLLEELFHLHCDERRLEVQAIIMAETTDFLTDRKRIGLKVPDDIHAFTHQILNRVALNRKVTFKYAQDFVKMQQEMIALGTSSQLLDATQYETLMPVREKVREYVKEYATIIKHQFGEKLAKQDCSPSPNCVNQVATAVFDSFSSIGGFSVATTITTGLGLLFSDHSSNPFPTASFTHDQALSFYWENIRFFPPVTGFPHWEKRPTCAGTSEAETAKLNAGDGKTRACTLGQPNLHTKFPEVNQYQGGKRVVGNIALAQQDPKKWGDDAHKFVIRPIEDYGKSLGFGERAVDASLESGKMNRVCPGKDLALMIGTTFFELFTKDEWAKPRHTIEFTNGPDWVKGFTLSSKEMVGFCGEICPICGKGKAHCFHTEGECLAAKAKCRLCTTCKRHKPDGWDLIQQAACLTCGAE